MYHSAVLVYQQLTMVRAVQAVYWYIPVWQEECADEKESSQGWVSRPNRLHIHPKLLCDYRRGINRARLQFRRTRLLLCAPARQRDTANPCYANGYWCA